MFLGCVLGIPPDGVIRLTVVLEPLVTMLTHLPSLCHLLPGEGESFCLGGTTPMPGVLKRLLVGQLTSIKPFVDQEFFFHAEDDALDCEYPAALGFCYVVCQKW